MACTFKDEQSKSAQVKIKTPCTFSFNQELKCCAMHNKQFQSPTPVHPFARLDYDWLVPELRAVDRNVGPCNKSPAQGETICLGKGLSYTCSMLSL